ncbi:MAG TPA: DUF1810 domain-containing protein [Nitrosospira sp.]|nr:DUF1810 domain-containing protein [Nitrosospira sp.]
MRLDKEGVGDPYNLRRFLDAQQPVYEAVRGELKDGCKRSHWMWFVFPQIEGLGQSHMAGKYAIKSREEGNAYLDHPVLGHRLRECAALVANLDGLLIEDIFGYPDDLKFRSSMTLFGEIAPGGGIFRECLEKYFEGKPDVKTLALLSARPS